MGQGWDGIVIFFLMMHLSFMPFRNSKEFVVAHHLECFSLAATFFTYWAALWFRQESSGVGIDALVCATLFINAGFLLYTFRIYCHKYKSTVTNHRLTRIATRKASQLVRGKQKPDAVVVAAEGAVPVTAQDAGTGHVETKLGARLISVEQRLTALEEKTSTTSHAVSAREN